MGFHKINYQTYIVSPHRCQIEEDKLIDQIWFHEILVNSLRLSDI